MEKLVTWLKNEDGQDALEYGLVIGIIAVFIIALLIIFGSKIQDLFTKAYDEISSVVH